MSEISIPLCQYFESYYRGYVLKGKKITNVKYVLDDLLGFLREKNYQKVYIDREIFEEWVLTFSELKVNTKYARIAVARRFFIYLSQLGNDSFIPVLPRRRESGYVPYVFSKDEVHRIFQSADALRARERHPESIMMSVPVILRLLYSTGIRISEALAIKNSQIDFDRHLIVLEITKNGHQRIAALTPSMEQEIVRYLSYRSKLPIAGIDSADKPLFVSGLGKQIRRNIVGRYFNKILEEAAIMRFDDGPCLHGLRHASCVHAFVNMIRQDKDPFAVLPTLSAFMGHRKILDTEIYLRFVRQMYPDLIKWDTAVMAPINQILKENLIKYEEKK